MLLCTSHKRVRHGSWVTLVTKRRSDHSAWRRMSQLSEKMVVFHGQEIRKIAALFSEIYAAWMSWAETYITQLSPRRSRRCGLIDRSLVCVSLPGSTGTSAWKCDAVSNGGASCSGVAPHSPSRREIRAVQWCVWPATCTRSHLPPTNRVVTTPATPDLRAPRFPWKSRR